MSTLSTGKYKCGLKIYFFNQSIIFLLFTIMTNCSKGSSSAVKCSWSLCFTKTDTDNYKVVCGSEVPEVLLKQECHTSNASNNQTVRGFKYFCCSSPKKRKTGRRKCSRPAKTGTMKWPNEHGEPTVVYFNCTEAPIGQYIDDFVVKFFLYTKDNDNPFDFKEIKVNNSKSLKKSGFIKGAPVKLIIHGYFSSAFNIITGPAIPLRKYYLLRNTAVNIIAVDWKLIANIPCYNIDAHFTKYVGERSALLLQFILDHDLVALENIHVIGHSLGAHAAGFTGKIFFQRTRRRLPRITGLDAAYPYFEHQPTSGRLDRTDADFVDVIHTGISPPTVLIGFLTLVRFGYKEPLGHADFYIHGGGNQPGCGNLLRYPGLCDHLRSYELYAESIQPPSSSVFRGRLCNNLQEALTRTCSGTKTVLMGECTEINNRSDSSQIYYVDTHSKSPYAADLRKPYDYAYCPNP